MHKIDLTNVDTSELTDQLRDRGLAVCVFQPIDVVARDGTEGWTGEQAAAWLASNRRRIEDRMCEMGNDTIDILLN